MSWETAIDEYHGCLRTENPFSRKKWKRLRYQALLAAGGRCQCCGACAADGVRLHVDHIKPKSRYPELEFDLGNLQVLCSDCNVGKGAEDETDWRVA